MNIGDFFLDEISGEKYLIIEIFQRGGQGEAYAVIPEANHVKEKQVLKIYLKSEQDRKERLKKIISQSGSLMVGFPDKTFCFPTSIVSNNNREGVLMPHAPETSSQMSMIFETPLNSAFSPKPFEMLMKGEVSYRTFVLIAFHLARAVERLYRNGFAHCDLSMNNIFINIKNAHVSIIDLDNISVPNYLSPTVWGTPGFSPPEAELMSGGKPDFKTDAHALAVLIFNLLVFRHPLIGSDLNVDFADEPFGKNALYTDHPTNPDNRFKGGFLVSNLPTEIQDLFEKAFVKGLHSPEERVSATKWLNPLWNLIDTLFDCKHCKRTSIFQSLGDLRCMFCKIENKKHFAVLRFSNSRIKIVSDGVNLYPHHFSKKNFDLSKIQGTFRQDKDFLIFYNISPDSLTVVGNDNKRVVLGSQKGVVVKSIKQIIFPDNTSCQVECL